MKSEGTVRSHIHMVLQISKIVVYVTTYSGMVVKCVCSIFAYKERRKYFIKRLI